MFFFKHCTKRIGKTCSAYKRQMLSLKKRKKKTIKQKQHSLKYKVFSKLGMGIELSTPQRKNQSWIKALIQTLNTQNQHEILTSCPVQHWHAVTKMNGGQYYDQTKRKSRHLFDAFPSTPDKRLLIFPSALNEAKIAPQYTERRTDELCLHWNICRWRDEL